MDLVPTQHGDSSLETADSAEEQHHTTDQGETTAPECQLDKLPETKPVETEEQTTDSTEENSEEENSETEEEHTFGLPEKSTMSLEEEEALVMQIVRSFYVRASRSPRAIREILDSDWNRRAMVVNHSGGRFTKDPYCISNDLYELHRNREVNITSINHQVITYTSNIVINVFHHDFSIPIKGDRRFRVMDLGIYLDDIILRARDNGDGTSTLRLQGFYRNCLRLSKADSIKARKPPNHWNKKSEWSRRGRKAKRMKKMAEDALMNAQNEHQNDCDLSQVCKEEAGSKMPLNDSDCVVREAGPNDKPSHEDNKDCGSMKETQEGE